MKEIRHNWTLEEMSAIYHQPLLELIFQAASTHRQHFNTGEVQVSKLISIKTGGCPEDCHYCPQAARYQTNIKRHGLMSVEEVVEQAKEAKTFGATRMCLGAAWREVKNNSQFDQVCDMVREINNLEMEACCTLGMLTSEQAEKLKEAGLYAYNHNVDTSAEHYEKIISTRTYQDRLNTLQNVRGAGITVCSGGIIGLGESLEDRFKMLQTLSQLDPHPESVPINTLIPIEGTPLAGQEKVSTWDLVRMIALTRIVLPSSFVRLSAGRSGRPFEAQALCFLAGANSIFIGDKLLTAPNQSLDADQVMFDLFQLKTIPAHAHAPVLETNDA